ncbi:hypothetical protein AT268_00060 [Bacillus cereus]|uniref:Uncharacterized protein n=1 Tax=Bacillus cereus TaxID=1396 RepID=A0A9X0MJ88_BACCE|nr:hypothetical protein [Bacillus cereus]KXY50543.1 hypothetical protein AT268_00060 [Bacillus cereus]
MSNRYNLYNYYQNFYYRSSLRQSQKEIALDIINEFKYLINNYLGELFIASSKIKLIVAYPSIENIEKIVKNELLACIQKIRDGMEKDIRPIIPLQDQYSYLPNNFDKTIDIARLKAKQTFWQCFNRAPSYKILSEYKNSIDIDTKFEVHISQH